MKKLIVLLLLISMLAAQMLTLASCVQKNPPTPDNGQVEPTPDPTPDPEPEPEPKPEPEPEPEPEKTIVVPEYKDYGRETVNFTELVYARPDIEGLVSAFADLVSAFKENAVSFEEQLNMIYELEDDYENLLTMYGLAQIYNSKDQADAFWLDEYSYVTTNYPKFSQAVEDMFVAAAQSEHRARFEEEYFGDLSDYVDGGQYTDRVVELMAEEAALEARYSGLSTATVEITVNGKTAVADEFLAKLNPASGSYDSMYKYYMEFYTAEVEKIQNELFVDLVKVRILLAEEMGYDSYVYLGYENMNHDYTPEQMMAMFGDVAEFVFPVYIDMYFAFFNRLASEQMLKMDYIDAVNMLYELFGEMDAKYQEAFAYMLQHGLYDIAKGSDDRYEGSFVTYLDGNNSPYLFVTTTGNVSDLATMSHEMGHFIDGYVNYGTSDSLNLAEVYSQALEFITMIRLEDKLTALKGGANGYQLYKYYEISSALEVILFQSLYSVFEHMIYDLDYDEITKERLDALVAEAAVFTLGNDYTDYFYPIEDLSMVLIPHLIEYPFYVQSYVTSLIGALEIFFLEVENEGAGLEAYNLLLQRGEEELPFIEELFRAGISNPFVEGKLKDIADELYYYIAGKHYYDSISGEVDAA